MLEVTFSKRHHVWAVILGSADDNEPRWRDLRQQELD